MKNSVFYKDDQMAQFVDAAERIKEQFGIKKALGYLIGEKFYSAAKMIYSEWDRMKKIEDLRKKPDYNPIRKYTGEFPFEINLDEDYEKAKQKIPKIQNTLTEFTKLIKNSFLEKQRSINNKNFQSE